MVVSWNRQGLIYDEADAAAPSGDSSAGTPRPGNRLGNRLGNRPAGGANMKIARRVAMSTEKVIESIHIMAASNRRCPNTIIAAGSGRQGKLAIPAIAEKIYATGKTVVSGIVDIHRPFIDSNWVFPYSPDCATN
jgi:hypothetical protein